MTQRKAKDRSTARVAGREEREQRLAAALRDNLRRRKAQARAKADKAATEVDDDKCVNRRGDA